MYVYMHKISILKETTKESSCSYSVLPIFHKRTILYSKWTHKKILLRAYSW
jgi:hypothetical protein